VHTSCIINSIGHEIEITESPVAYMFFATPGVWRTMLGILTSLQTPAANLLLQNNACSFPAVQLANA
jgi:hypothetical protein